ncbi:hypothetical protein MK079_00245 [Candidatus Gracilibacteria bacterium]|nr:hypothetical protein [Candidatus Gracilibacteria bacterium]
MKLLSREDWGKIQPKDLGLSDCPFCKIDNDYLLYTGEYFSIKRNKYPYLGEKDCLLVIPHRHIEYTHELTSEEMSSFPEIEVFMKNFFKGRDYFSFIRQSMGNRSLRHLHYHYIPGTISSSCVDAILEKNKKKTMKKSNF